MSNADAPPGDEWLLTRVRQAGERLRAELDDISADSAVGDERVTAQRVESALGGCLDALAATGVWGEANRVASSELWRIAGPVLALGWLQNHARTKPRGYAGDFEMLAKIAADWRCEHPLGRHFDRFFQSQAAPEAVRARIELCGAKVAEGLGRQEKNTPFRVASVGCGPALDLVHAARLLPEEARGRLHVLLLDLDDEALAAASSNLSPWLATEQVTLVRTNLFRLAQRPSDLGGPFDAILCTGLFDYLEPAAATGLLRLFWQSLSPGGWLLVGNFGPENPTRAYMEWIGNWYLKYRSATELMELAERARIPPEAATVSTERTGVNLILHAKRE